MIKGIMCFMRIKNKETAIIKIIIIAIITTTFFETIIIRDY